MLHVWLVPAHEHPCPKGNLYPPAWELGSCNSHECHSLTASCKSTSLSFLSCCAQEGLVLEAIMQELNGSLGEMTGQRGCGDVCRCMEGVDCEEHKCFLVQATLTKKRLICSTVAFSLLPPPSVESFNHVGAVKFQPWNGAFVQSFWRLPWSAGSFSCPFLNFF